MLFGYPIAATVNNWFHDCLVAAIQSVHVFVDAGDPLPDWPGVIPAARQDSLRRKRGLRKRFETYARAIAGLTLAERNQVLTALDEENRIADLVQGVGDCACIADLHATAQAPLRDLFEFSFELLRDLGVRDQHYREIYEDLGHKICPFCGIEAFDAPGAPREALDHYLDKATYPLAAANLRNLVPMGTKCNSRYKHTADILRNAHGRRRSCDPYDTAGISINLAGTAPFGGSKPELPEWQINCDPVCEEAKTWDDVFSVIERYRRDILDPYYKKWIDEFSEFAKRKTIDSEDDAAVLGALEDMESIYSSMGLSDIGFLRAAVFRMLRDEIGGGNARLGAIVKRAVAAPL